jgi:hypothetical protein
LIFLKENLIPDCEKEELRGNNCQHYLHSQNSVTSNTAGIYNLSAAAEVHLLLLCSSSNTTDQRAHQ